MGLYISITYAGEWSGEEPVHETRHATTGELFRSLAGKDNRYPWESLGRCTGRMYIDGPDGKPVQRGWVFEARVEGSRRESWVTVHDAPNTVTIQPHFHDFRN